jgi:hypothetical protein
MPLSTYSWGSGWHPPHSTQLAYSFVASCGLTVQALDGGDWPSPSPQWGCCWSSWPWRVTSTWAERVWQHGCGVAAHIGAKRPTLGGTLVTVLRGWVPAVPWSESQRVVLDPVVRFRCFRSSSAAIGVRWNPGAAHVLDLVGVSLWSCLLRVVGAFDRRRASPSYRGVRCSRAPLNVRPPYKSGPFWAKCFGFRYFGKLAFWKLVILAFSAEFDANPSARLTRWPHKLRARAGTPDSALGTNSKKGKEIYVQHTGLKLRDVYSSAIRTAGYILRRTLWHSHAGRYFCEAGIAGGASTRLASMVRGPQWHGAEILRAVVWCWGKFERWDRWQCT